MSETPGETPLEHSEHAIEEAKEAASHVHHLEHDEDYPGFATGGEPARQDQDDA